MLCLTESAVAAEASDRVRLAYLFNFTKFVEWPVESGPFNLCIENNHRFTGLTSALTGKQVRGRNIEIMLFEPLNTEASVQNLASCQLIYLTTTNTFAHQLPNVSALVVGEGDVFARDLGVIGFVVENDRLRYVVNNTRAKSLQLKISARMLEVAKDVF